MTSSADQEVKQNLISTVGGEVTIPEPVKGPGFLLKERTVIATVTSDRIITKSNNRFLGRLSLNRVTGQYTIRSLQNNDSGFYTVDQEDTYKSESFKLSVYDAVLEPGVTVASVSSERCTLLCAVDQLSGGTLSWYQGEVLVNQSSTQRSLPLTVVRLGLRSSYRCVSANPAGNLTRSVDAKTSCTVQHLALQATLIVILISVCLVSSVVFSSLLLLQLLCVYFIE
uniref:Ig-like domain-containing protein n=1 Tax=Gadus morhua TaxID=8049 RepID=A0A8C5AYS7_GADMO